MIDNQASGTYAKAIRSLMYAAIGTWPDIAYAVYTLAKFTRSSQPRHWTAIKCVFQCLKGTCTYMLTYGRSDQEQKPELNMYCDAKFRQEIYQWICIPTCQQCHIMELKEASNHHVIDSRSQVHCCYTHCQANFMVLITIQ